MVFPNLPDPEEDQIDKNDLWFDIPVSSSKACQEKLAEERGYKIVDHRLVLYVEPIADE